MNRWIIAGIVVGGVVAGYLVYSSVKEATTPKRIDRYVAQRRQELNRKYSPQF